MNCFECARRGSTTVAVAICRYCNAGLCLDHMREAAVDRSRGGLQTACSHMTWDPSPRTAEGSPDVVIDA